MSTAAMLPGGRARASWSSIVGSPSNGASPSKAVVIDNVSDTNIDHYLTGVCAELSGSSITHASRISGGNVCVFLNTEENVQKLITSGGITVNGVYAAVRRYVTAATKVVISNVFPFLPNGLILSKLAVYGKVIGHLRDIPTGSKLPGCGHVKSFRKVIHIIFDDINNAPERIQLQYEGSNFTVFLSLDEVVCHNCSGIGHVMKNCKKPPVASTDHAPDQSSSVRTAPVGQSVRNLKLSDVITHSTVSLRPEATSSTCLGPAIPARVRRSSLPLAGDVTPFPPLPPVSTIPRSASELGAPVDTTPPASGTITPPDIQTLSNDTNAFRTSGHDSDVLKMPPPLAQRIPCVTDTNLASAAVHTPPPAPRVPCESDRTLESAAVVDTLSAPVSAPAESKMDTSSSLAVVTTATKKSWSDDQDDVPSDAESHASGTSQYDFSDITDFSALHEVVTPPLSEDKFTAFLKASRSFKRIMPIARCYTMDYAGLYKMLHRASTRVKDINLRRRILRIMQALNTEFDLNLE